MPIDNFEERLKASDDAFKNASADGGGMFELPEPGIYQAIFRAVDFFEQKDPPNCAFLKLVFEVVLDSKYDGRDVEMVYNLEPHKLAKTPAEVETKLGFLKRDLKTLGIDVEGDDFTLSQVRPGSDIWTPIMDVPVEIRVKDSKKINPNTDRPYRNAYLDGRTGDPLPKGQRPTPQSDIPVEPVVGSVANNAPADDDEIPF